MPDVILVRRVPVPAEPLIADSSFDYADAFELRLDRPDTHSAEQWVRTGVDNAAVRRLVVAVHRHVLRFRLGPADAGHVLGWRIVSSTPDVLQLATAGALGRGAIVARRTGADAFLLTTFVFFDSAAGPPVWVFVGPLHRRVAPYLLKRAARTLLAGSVGARGVNAS